MQLRPLLALAVGLLTAACAPVAAAAAAAAAASAPPQHQAPGRRGSLLARFRRETVRRSRLARRRRSRDGSREDSAEGLAYDVMGGVSMNENIEMAGGVEDAVANGLEKVHGSLSAINGLMSEQLAAGGERKSKQGQRLVALQKQREQLLAQAAALGAEVDHLAKLEAESHASYEQTVSRRWQETEDFVTRTFVLAERRRALVGLLEKIRARRDLVTSPGFGTTPDPDAPDPIEAPFAPTTKESSSLDMIMGVFMSMLHSVTNDLEQDTLKWQEGDREMRKLVESHKTSLQHLNAQYIETNTQRRAKLSDMLNVTNETSMQKTFQELETSTAGPLNAIRRRLYVLVQRDAQALAPFKGQMDKALTLMEEVKTWTSTSTTTTTTTTTITTTSTTVTTTTSDLIFAQLGDGDGEIFAQLDFAGPPPAARPSRLRQLQVMSRRLQSPASRPPGDKGEQEPARTFAATAARELPFPEGADPQVVELAKGMWSAAVRNRGEKTLEAIAAMLPAKNLAEDIKVLNMLSHGASSGASADPTHEDLDRHVGTIRECAVEKQKLTAEILNARALQRDARVAASLAEARMAAIDFELPLVAQQSDAFAQARDAQGLPFQDLLAEAETYDATLADALVEMGNVAANVGQYAADPAAPPRAQEIAGELGPVQASLEGLKSSPPAGWAELQGLYTQATVKFSEAVLKLNERLTKLEAERSAREELRTRALASLQEQEASEVAFMGQRNITDGQCETVGIESLDFSADFVNRTRTQMGGLADA